MERASRWNRWLYHGFHSLDFPFLYYKRPLWDIVVILLEPRRHRDQRDVGAAGVAAAHAPRESLGAEGGARHRSRPRR